MFLPQLLFAAKVLRGHILEPLFKALSPPSFLYYCPPGQRHLRYARGALPPVDFLEEQREGTAEKEILVAVARHAAANRRLQAGAKAPPAGVNRRAEAASVGAKGVAAAPSRSTRAAPSVSGCTAAPLPPGEGLVLYNCRGLPKFYHSRTCVALTQAELRGQSDSGDEVDVEEWQVRPAAYWVCELYWGVKRICFFII